MRETERKLLALCLALIVLGYGGGLLAANVQPPLVVGQLRDGIPEMSERVDAIVLAADTAESYTVPANPQEPSARVAIAFSSTCADYYVRRGGTAVIPVADVVDGTAPIRNPSRRMFEPNDVLSLRAPTACTIFLERGLSRG